jgi:hypothetical protein
VADPPASGIFAAMLSQACFGEMIERRAGQTGGFGVPDCEPEIVAAQRPDRPQDLTGS